MSRRLLVPIALALLLLPPPVGVPFFRDRPAWHWASALRDDGPMAIYDTLLHGGERAAPTLGFIALHGDRKLSDHARWILANMGPSGAPVLASLLSALQRDLGGEDRRWLAWTVGRSCGGAEIEEALIAFIRREDDAPARLEALEALLEVGRRDGRTGHVLVDALADDDAQIRELAIEQLALTGHGTPRAIRALRRTAASDSEPRHRLWAALALWDLGEDDAALRGAIRAGIKRGARRLPDIRRALPVEPEILDGLFDWARHHRCERSAMWAAFERAKLDGDVAGAVGRLVAFLAMDAYYAEKAAHHLGRLGPAARSAIPALLRWVGRRGEGGRPASREAIRALCRIDGADGRFTDALLETLDDQRSWGFRDDEIARGLGFSRSRRAEVLAALRRLAGSRTWRVRAAAVEALEALGGT